MLHVLSVKQQKVFKGVRTTPTVSIPQGVIRDYVFMLGFYMIWYIRKQGLGHGLFFIMAFLCQQGDMTLTPCASTNVIAIQNISGTTTTRLPSCMNITIGRHQIEMMADGHFQFGIGYPVENATFRRIAFNDNDSGTICFPLSPQLMQCTLLDIAKNDYQIQNLTLFRGTNLIAELGDYYVDGSGRAYTCNPPIRTSKTAPRCHYVPLNNDQYVILPNGSLFIKSAQVLVNHPRYTSNNQTGKVNICYPLTTEFLNCAPWYHKLISPYRYSLQNNLQLYYMADNLLFDVGDYYVVNGQNDVKLCVNNTIIFRLLRMSMIVSNICLILAFIYQWMEPRTTCYKKCFLCHNFSLAVECIWFTYERYEDHWPTSYFGKYNEFVIGYFSSISAASWLAIAGYDIWQSFVSLNHCHRRTEGTKRFLYYSIIGWGTPLILLAIVLMVNFCKGIQTATSLSPNLEIGGWFHDHRTSYIFYYGPLQTLYCVNVILFFCTIYQIRKLEKGIHLVQNQQKQQLLRVSLKLSFVMGVFWSIECILWFVREFTTFPIRYISDGIIVLQGMVFFWLTTSNNQTPSLLREKLQMAKSKVMATFDRRKQSL